jgi:AraC family transcriptional regulator
MIKQETQSYYQQKSDVLLQYIGNNLDGDLSVKTLSEQSGISLFHFHRIMKAALNEPLGSYINRIRLETAIKLIRYGDTPFQEIASRIGYQDISAFSKAFTKEFGISPNDFKTDKNSILNTHIDYHITESKKLAADLRPKIKTLPDRMVYYISVKGLYGGPEVMKTWEELGEFVIKNKIAGWNPDFFSIYYDDGEIVGYENAVSDLCFASKKMVKTTSNIETKNVPGGKFAVFRYKGPYDYLWDLYDSIFRVWVLNTDCKLRDAPIFEKYLNFSDKIKPENLLTEISIPIV